MRNGGDRPARPPRKPSVPDIDTQVKFDNPDDAELEPEADGAALAEEAETLVALDNPDDADMYDEDAPIEEGEWSSERSI